MSAAQPENATEAIYGSETALDMAFLGSLEGATRVQAEAVMAEQG